MRLTMPIKGLDVEEQAAVDTAKALNRIADALEALLAATPGTNTPKPEKGQEGASNGPILDSKGCI